MVTVMLQKKDLCTKLQNQYSLFKLQMSTIGFEDCFEKKFLENFTISENQSATFNYEWSKRSNSSSDFSNNTCEKNFESGFLDVRNEKKNFCFHQFKKQEENKMYYHKMLLLSKLLFFQYLTYSLLLVLISCGVYQVAILCHNSSKTFHSFHFFSKLKIINLIRDRSTNDGIEFLTIGKMKRKVEK